MTNKVYHLEVEDEPVEEHWIAIHTSLEAHQIAFYINKHTSMLFKRVKKDLKNEKREGVFLLFEWEDLISDVKCQLISNKSIQEISIGKTNNSTLFELPEINEVSLLSEFKQADFFIKSTNIDTLKTIQNQLSNWYKVTMSYKISLEKIKNQLNLIFD
jgi:hypothetical protein